MTTDAVTAKLIAAQDAIDAADSKLAESHVLISDALELLSGEASGGDVIDVHPGDDLKAMIADAPDGATLRIDPAFVTDLGTFTLGKTLKLVSGAELAPGRVTPALVGPRLLKASVNVTASACELRGLYLEGQGQTILTAGEGMTVDRCVLVGAPNQQQQRGIAANAADITITGCHIGSIYKDVDTQAVCCWNKTKHLQIRDCFLEAAGENFMTGGADPSSEADIPTDIVIEDCTISKPLAWMELPGCTVKNLLELKNVIGFTLRRCLLEYSWAHGQAGYAIVLAVRNQSGTAPYSTIRDVVIEDCTIRHVGGGLSILGRDDRADYPSQVMTNVQFRRNTIEDLSKSWARGSALAAGRAYNISGGPADLVIEDCNTNLLPGSQNAAIGFDQVQHQCARLAFRRCELYEGAYGITGTADGGIGEPQLAGHAPGYVWEDVTMQRGTSGRKIVYPPDTTVLPPVGADEDDGDPEGRDRAATR